MKNIIIIIIIFTENDEKKTIFFVNSKVLHRAMITLEV